MFSLCLMRWWYCRGISVEIEMYFDSIMDSIKTHQSDHCRMERRRRGWRRRAVMQSGAGAAAAGRGHHAPRCCHSCSVLTQTRDTDWWPGHQHQETESSESGSIPALYWSSIDWQYSAIQLVCHLHPQLPNVLHIRRNKLERRRKMLLNLKVEFAFHSDCCL